MRLLAHPASKTIEMMEETHAIVRKSAPDHARGDAADRVRGAAARRGGLRQPGPRGRRLRPGRRREVHLQRQQCRGLGADHRHALGDRRRSRRSRQAGHPLSVRHQEGHRLGGVAGQHRDQAEQGEIQGLHGRAGHEGIRPARARPHGDGRATHALRRQSWRARSRGGVRCERFEGQAGVHLGRLRHRAEGGLAGRGGGAAAWRHDRHQPVGPDRSAANGQAEQRQAGLARCSSGRRPRAGRRCRAARACRRRTA